MFVDDIKTLQELNIPKFIKEDAIVCVRAKMAYRDKPNEDTLIDLKSTFEDAFTTLKSEKVLGRVSLVDYETICNIIKKVDEF